MRLNIFLLLYFFVAIFTFGIADHRQPNCHLSKLLKNVSPSKRLVQPQNNGQYSRFTDGKYAMVGKDPITFWVKLRSNDLDGITVKYSKSSVTDFGKYMVIQPFGLEDCQQKKYNLNGPKSSGSFELLKCNCDLYMTNNVAYLPVEAWINSDSHKIGFEQYGEKLGLYVFEEEAKMWNSLKTCKNAGILSQDLTAELNGHKIYGVVATNEKQVPDVSAGPFYQKDGRDYVNFNNYDVVMFLLVRDWTIKPHMRIELKDGKTLHQSVEIKIEVNGEAPDGKAVIPINDGTGLKIDFKLTRCLQFDIYNGLVRFVVRVSEPELFRASFYDQMDNHLNMYIPLETILLYKGPVHTARSNNHFTSYWIIYTPPNEIGTKETPPNETGSKEASLSNPDGSKKASLHSSNDCNSDLFLWLLIVFICIDILLVIILILLTIFAHRGSKKMKAAMLKKKTKDPKAAAAIPTKQACAATVTSPMATPIPTKKEATEKKMKSTEKEIKGKTAATAGGGKKSTDGKTTTFYTVDQTKYHTVDNTFNKSKKGKK